MSLRPETAEMPALARALAAGPPLESSDWALDRDGLEFVLGEVEGGRTTAIECGSGLSTVLIARLLRERGRGTVHALEHDAEWARLTRASIEAEQLGAYATVIAAPLTRTALGSPNAHWYDGAALVELPRDADLLLIDGPPAAPAGETNRARHPALPMLAGHLAAGCLVLLDDADRDGERWAIDRWRADLGVDLVPCGARLAAATIASPARLCERAAMLSARAVRIEGLPSGCNAAP